MSGTPVRKEQRRTVVCTRQNEGGLERIDKSKLKMRTARGSRFWWKKEFAGTETSRKCGEAEAEVNKQSKRDGTKFERRERSISRKHVFSWERLALVKYEYGLSMRTERLNAVRGILDFSVHGVYGIEFGVAAKYARLQVKRWRGHASMRIRRRLRDNGNEESIVLDRRRTAAETKCRLEGFAPGLNKENSERIRTVNAIRDDLKKASELKRELAERWIGYSSPEIRHGSTIGLRM
ncbi:hypothetical protein C8R43DRAFT_959494 [Mycena crocata]|nr:hypothetical protein C8R43DRAFT_959494 [Mycena crocata]